LHCDLWGNAIRSPETMKATRRERITKKRNAATVRVVAVRHPPKGDISSEALVARSPYVTDHGYAEFFHAIADRMPSDLSSSKPQTEEIMEIGQDIWEFIKTNQPPLSAHEIPVMITVLLSVLQEKIFQGIYQGSKRNPLYAMEAFVTFQNFGLYPPLWTLDWLNEAFVAYMNSNGEKRLENLLGITRRKGQTPIFKEEAAVRAESAEMREIGGLTIFGISIDDAAFMVEQRLRKSKMKCPNAETLAERFVKRGWSKSYKPFKAFANAMPLDARKNVLAKYPQDAIPEKFR